MRLLKRALEKGGEGFISMVSEEPEDMWHAYHLITRGDRLRASTIRRVQKTTATGTSDSARVRITIVLIVSSIHFEPASNLLRINGQNVSESQHIKLGAWHSIDLELNRNFTIYKDHWDSIALERVRAACDPMERAEVAAVILNEGLANVCLITSTMTIVRARIEMAIPRKRKGSQAQHGKALDRFYSAVLEALLRHINFAVVKCVIVASPGYIRDTLLSYMFAEATKRDIKPLLDNKSKFMSVHSSSGHKYALKEVLLDPGVMTKMQNTKALAEVAALHQFYEMLRLDPSRAIYGYTHCEQAAETGAVATLLLTDELFRAATVEKRKQYVSLVDKVKSGGGEVHIFSALHVSGEQLAQLTGIAAILRFGIPELEEELPVDGDQAGSESDLSSGYDSDSDEDDENALSGDRATIHAMAAALGRAGGDARAADAFAASSASASAAAAAAAPLPAGSDFMRAALHDAGEGTDADVVDEEDDLADDDEGMRLYGMKMKNAHAPEEQLM